MTKKHEKVQFGREAQTSDIIITNNDSVSRIHAHFIYRKGIIEKNRKGGFFNDSFEFDDKNE